VHKVDARAPCAAPTRSSAAVFAHIERRAREAGRELSSLTLAEMDVWWEEAKTLPD